MLGGGMGLIGLSGIGMILFWILIVAVFMGISRGIVGNRNESNIVSHPRRQAPLEILQSRFAKGEISQQEYEEARRML